MRNSSRRISTSPPTDDNILASSSAGWKAVALPLTETDRRTPMPAPEPRRASRSSKQMAAAMAEPALGSADSHTPISTFVAKRPARPSRAPLFATVGLGLAAAAGVVVYVANKDQSAADQTAIATSASGSSAAPGATVTPLPDPAPITAQPIEGAASGSASDAVAAQDPASAPPAAAPGAPDQAVATAQGDRGDQGKTVRGKPKKGRVERDVVAKTEIRKPEIKAPLASGAAVVKTPPLKDSKDGEPSFEELLKEANIQDKKQDAAPSLEKKSLTGADITKGMRSVQPKAQGCYNGTQGTAAVKLTVEPSGKVQKVSVTGAFAGTPVAACVEKAVKGATFPAWDGGPQSFAYSYLLSE
ncbi:MAG: hypothetical protein WKG01_39145 [Kofleriaceae bacterium]